MKSLPVKAGRYTTQPGRRLRTLREERRMTLDQLAEATGLSKGFLSRMERDVTSPSVASLVTVCEVLGVSPGTVLESPDTILTHLDTAPTVDLGGTGIVERLLTPRNQRELQIVHADIAAGGHSEEDMYTMDCSVESVHVISGEFVLSTPDQEFHLRTGDTVTLPGAEPHSWRNPGTGPTRVLWVLAKPRS